MSETGAEGIRWKAVILGLTVAVLVGFAITPILAVLYRYAAAAPVHRGQLTADATVVSLTAGFVAYLAGGYVAGRSARVACGRTGATTAVLGLLAGLVLAGVLETPGIVLMSGVALPPVGFGLTAKALVAGALLFAVNLFGAYVGGRLGEPLPTTERRTARGARPGG